MRLIAALISGLVLVACQEARAPEVVDVPKVHDMADYSAELARFVRIETGMHRDTAEAEIRTYFGGEVSGGSLPIFNTKTLPSGEFQIVATRDGLTDDSIKGERLIARFSNDILTAYGMRVKCYRGPNPDKWTASRCP